MQRTAAVGSEGRRRRFLVQGTKFSRCLEAEVEHVANHNAFSILFMVSFFASLAMVMIQFG